MEPEERPSSGKTGRILHMCLEGHRIGLYAAAFVDRHLAVRSAHLQNQDGLVRPRSGSEKALIGVGIYKHVVEAGIARAVGGSRGDIRHAEAGSEQDPL